MKSVYERVAIEAALQAGHFIRRSVGRVRHISYKDNSATNIVTDVDKRSEAMITRHLRRAFPGHAILAEETGRDKVRSPYVWIIDPLDGTSNFAHAFPFFCVSIGLEHNGRIVLGVVYDPNRNELFTAAAGKGARLNGKRIRVSGVRKLEKSFLATGFSYGKRRKGRNVRNFEALLTRTMAIRRAGSAALDLSYVACGRFDGFWELDLHPWDSAAGMLLVEEAGGAVSRFDGSTYSPHDKNILATNGTIHRQMSRILTG